MASFRFENVDACALLRPCATGNAELGGDKSMSNVDVESGIPCFTTMTRIMMESLRTGRLISAGSAGAKATDNQIAAAVGDSKSSTETKKK